MKKSHYILIMLVNFTTICLSQTTCFPQAGMSDLKLEKSIIDAFKTKGWDEQPVKAIILSKDWKTRRNETTGVIIARELNVLIVSTRKNGTKCITQDFNFQSDYNGSGYSKEIYMGSIGVQKKISCDCLK